MARWWGAVALGLTLAACGGQAGTGGVEVEATRQACARFRSLAGDVAGGVLTPTEIRSRLKDIDDVAPVATPGVRVASRGMLAAVTQDDQAALDAAVRSMGQACDAAGR